MRPAALLFGALLCPAAAGRDLPAAPPALQIVEQASHEGFPLERPFQDRGPGKLEAVGVYLRYREEQKLYALCLYVDVARLRRLTAGTARTPAQLAALLVAGRVRHAFVTRFVEPLPRERRMRFLLGNLEKAWPGPGFDPEAPGLRRFAAFFDRPVPRGAETQVWIDTRGGIAAREAGGPATRVRDPRLRQAFTASYLGEQPMDPEMKATLLAELPQILALDDLLATPVAGGHRPPGH